ncbi:hypothetical protein [Halomonas sp. E19]|uniref:hypothetical protein n=1 Tax=Halomonas sp. E19 TaxID=3397247 RepID=UPI0040331E24
MGEKVRHYFAHSNSDRPCSTGAETGIHLAAKQLIADRLAIPVPSLTASVEAADSRGHKLSVSKKIYPGTDRHPVTHAALEVGLGDVRPDLVVTLGGVQILIEVAVTHYIDEEKRRRLDERGLRCIEISLGHVQRTLTLNVLEDEIYNQFNAMWIVNPRLAEARPELEATLAEKIAHANERNRRADERDARKRQLQREGAIRAKELRLADDKKRVYETFESAQRRCEEERRLMERDTQSLNNMEAEARRLFTACQELATKLAATEYTDWQELVAAESLTQLDRHIHNGIARMHIETPPSALMSSTPGDWVFGIAPMAWKLGMFLDVIFTPQMLSGIKEKWLSMADMMESARFLGLKEVALLVEARQLHDKARELQLLEVLPDVNRLATLPDDRQAIMGFVGDLANFNMIELVPGITIEFTFRGLPPNRWAD